MEKISAHVWEQMQVLFHLSADKTEAEMEAVLLESCPDPELRQEVRRLIRSLPADQDADDSEAYLEDSPSSSGMQTPAPGRFGAYHVVRHLGSGGTAVVYLVERRTGSSVQQFALKVFPGFESESFFTRSLKREETILATLAHPSIPKLLDVGVSARGEPFLVMEFAQGEPLDVFCDKRRLGIYERLQLMLRVCEAVAYAHRKLIVHLDLKPSNLLAGEEEPRVKLLDFGTSKLLEAGRTMAIAYMATPGYAAPEQLRGEPTTTSCDVFALGAVLFELLSGRKAFPDVSPAAMAERTHGTFSAGPLESVLVREAAAARNTTSTTLQRQLRGDLTTIVTKCLAASPEDRYSSVEALAEDLRRHLEGRPIRARRSKMYRLRKFLARHVTEIVTSSIVILLLGGMLGYVVQRDRQAQRDGVRAAELSSFFYKLLATANPDYTGKPAASVPELLGSIASLVPQFVHNPSDLRAMQLAIADSMIDDGDRAAAKKLLRDVRVEAQNGKELNQLVEADAFLSRLEAQDGALDQALTLSAEAAELAAHHDLSPPEQIWADIAFAEVRENTGERTDTNLARLREAVRIAHAPEISGRLRAEAQYALASDLEMRGGLEEAEALIRDNLTIYQKESHTECHQSQMLADLGYITGARGNQAGSVPMFQQAFDGARACRGPDAHDTLLIQNFLAGALLHSGNPLAAQTLMRDALPRWRRAGAGGIDLSNALLYSASAELANGDLQTAEQHGADLLVEVHRSAQPGSHILGSSEKVFAETLIAEGKDHDALPHAELAADVLQKTATTPATRDQARSMADELRQLKNRLGKVR